MLHRPHHFALVIVAFLLLLGLTSPHSPPAPQLEEQDKIDTLEKDFSLCVPCPPKYTHLLSPSCSDCKVSCDESGQSNPQGDSCGLLFWGLCVVSSNQSELCATPFALDGSFDVAQYERDVDYAISLTTACGDLLQKCETNTACSNNVNDFVTQSMQGNTMLPSVYCDTHTCSSLFRDVGQCATVVASQGRCQHDSECATESFVCNHRTHRCMPDIHCCDDLSQPNCCACLLGNIGVDDFFDSFCAMLNNTTNSTDGHDMILPGCYAACGQGGAIRGCVDHNGTVRDYGEQWIEGCNSFTCESNGHIIRSSVVCPSEANCPIELRVRYLGQCCETCRGCENDMGEWQTCSGDCSHATCSPLNCSAEFQVTSSGACCPTCQGCLGEDGEWWHVGEIWQEGCDVYTCNSSGQSMVITETRIACANLSCPSEFQVTLPNQCCPVCQGCINTTGEWFHCECSNVTCESPACPQEFQIAEFEALPVSSVAMGLNCTICLTCSGCVDSDLVWHHIGEVWQTGCQTFTCNSTGAISTTNVTCPHLTCPRSNQHTPDNQCCPVCQGCMDIENGEWHQCACSELCPILSCPLAHQVTIPGECCATCQGCRDSNGSWHHVGDTWQQACSILTCTENNTISSSSVTCPQLNCSVDMQATFDGQCCPVCRGCLNTTNGNWSSCPCGSPCVRQPSCPEDFRVFRPGSCCLGCRGCKDTTDGTWHHIGDTWQSDCHIHTCNASGSLVTVSASEKCANLSCPASLQVFLPDQCCPVCRGCQDISTHDWHVCTCNVNAQCNELTCPAEFHMNLPDLCCPVCEGCKDDNGTWHHVGERWQDGCVQSTCKHNGGISHMNLTSMCHNLSCPVDFQVLLEGQCCPVCQGCRDNATGDWHNCTSSCSDANCTSLSCPHEFQITLPNECCPSCQGCSDGEGNWFHVGEKWQSNCELFNCRSIDNVKHSNVTCSPLWCPLEIQTTPLNQCCPICQ